MRPRRLDLVGMTFGRWTVTAKIDGPGHQSYWRCRCECGAERTVQGGTLRNGRSQSCGCLLREAASARFTKHGDHTLSLRSGTKEYRAWKDAKARCHNTKHASYPEYGARGITVCDRWRTDYAAFLADMGRAPTPQHSLDRIDPNGIYEPQNCRWADPYTQATNTRRQPRAIALATGERMTARRFADTNGVDPKALHRRLNLGESPEDALRHIKEQRPNRW